MLSSLAQELIRAAPFRGRMWALRRLWPSLAGRPLASRYGPFMVVRRDYTNLACLTGCLASSYDDVRDALTALEPGMAFVDVGANAGLFACMAGQRVGAGGVVLAFEPGPETFADLVRNIELNRLRNVHPFRLAIGPAEGMQRFFTGEAGHTGTARLDDAGDIAVPTVRFDGQPLFDRIVGDRRTVVKIDVEGFEAQVIEAMSDFLSMPKVRRLIVEVDEAYLGRTGAGAAALYGQLARLGFRPLRGPGSASHYNEVFDR